MLQQYATETWESVLHFMVGTPTDKRSKAITRLLEQCGLMTRVSVFSDGTPSLQITNKGFQFLLQDMSTQVWAFLIQYLEMSNELNMDPIEVLSFFFQLGFMEVGKDYSMAALSEPQRVLVEDLKGLGLVYMKKVSFNINV
jgi:transcription initiation factor TFIIH subunit 4